MANQLPQGWKEVPFDAIFDTCNSGKEKIKQSEYMEQNDDLVPVVDQGQNLISGYSNQYNKVIEVTDTPLIIFGDHTRCVKYIDFNFIVGADGTQLIRTKKNTMAKLGYYQLLAKDIPCNGYSRHFKYVKAETYKLIEDTEEQQYIVDTLDAVAEMIRLRKETIQLTKNLIPSIFQEMFGDPIKNSKGWKMKTFQEVLTIKNGKSQKDVENAKGIYPIYGSAGEIMGYANDFICNENSVIIGRKGNINSPKLIKTKFWNVDTAFGLEPNEGLNYNYLYVFCLLYNFEKHNRAVVIPSLVKSDLLEIKIPFPLLSMQEKFSDRIEQINKNIEIQQKDLNRLQELFDQLLQKAFTGELTRGEAIDGVI